ncbi:MULTISPECIES: hypothetical protein [Arthrobacter]|uniref:Uncharacterized protein n=1 Tax=Arthrobacter terricola TaxID=2547396 RepID=A0A4R5KMM7_9MICC|nr:MULTISPECIES: hypothetical protein [Arthrobacter]MBT8161015.1 hypothetical protein [Arthrobacter sp. GN70]TDF96879.1 hypothetical protein E1809_09150 [Arthrobacter terricola]
MNKLEEPGFFIAVDERKMRRFEDEIKALENAEERLAAAERRVEAYERKLAKIRAKVEATADERQIAAEQGAKLRRLQDAVARRRQELTELQSLMTTAPNAPTDKKFRHRTGNDDHLELGLPKRPKPEEVPIFPVTVIPAEEAS